jgi:hypothetical protein
MPDVPKDITWYDITKDLVIPLLGVLTTIGVGTIIAYLLKNKEEKAKIKTLLIDNYMLYLNKKVAFFDNELTSFKYQILKDIFISYDSYFKSHANDHLAKEKVSKLRDKLKEKLEQKNQGDTNWSPFTYRFTFLLGKKKYFKHVQPLENAVLKDYISDKARSGFLANLKTQIMSDDVIVEEMNSSNTNKIVDALDRIEFMIAESYTQFQFKIFNPFDTKLADLIDEY